MKMIALAAALAAGSLGVPAVAQTQRPVVVHDLDLSRPADRAQLDRRIRIAAHQVCTDRSSALYGSYAAARGCIAATRSAATVQAQALAAATPPVAVAAR